MRHLESREQVTVIEWADRMSRRHPALRLLYHTPNGGSRNRIEASNLKRQGVKPGVPDLTLPVAVEPYHGLYIEMKSEKGRLSTYQKEWIAALRENGFRAEVCYSANDAINVLRDYLGIA